MTVILDKSDYIEKAKQLLNDSTTYRRLENDRTTQLANKINKALKELKNANKLTKEEHWKMKTGDANIAQFYGLPKVHKENVPLRPIVSLPGTPAYNLSKELWKRVKHLIKGSTYSINNAGQFLDKLKNIQIEEDEIMVSFDVTSLFTSVNLDLARTTVAELLHEHGTTGGTLEKEDICKLLDLCLTTYFEFDGEFYEQLKGAPMGSPISGFIAEVIMQRLERTILPTLEPKIWVRYVDDTFTIIKKNDLERTHQLINNVFEDIKFTMETENNNKLAFLDVLITRNASGELHTEVYRKGTHTDQILSYNSNHPKCHKRSCIRTLFRRIETHCNTTEAKLREEKHLFQMFQNNGYPRSFIRRSLRTSRQRSETPPSQNRRITLPYVKNISEMTARLLNQHGLTVAHKPTNTLRKALTKPKGRRENMDKINVIYKIPCSQCDKHYVGQTGRKLSTRIHEHKLASRRHDPLSLVSVHEDQEGHQFNWDMVSILAQARTKKEREFIEAWYSTEQAINRHIDFDSAYQPLRRKLLKKYNSRTNNTTQDNGQRTAD